MMLFQLQDRIDEHTDLMSLQNLKKGKVACEDITGRKTTEIFLSTQKFLEPKKEKDNCFMFTVLNA